ncbi:MAG: tRNA-dihydrouridine synthase family protein [Desulfopila sp.]|jgi:nifR3 family TIM-barrel protein|nr:tRNA-dihydrouridine synthase family protein [Desulfopila sp.]
MLKIRNITVDPPLALAPMVGLSHSALRTLILELGGVGLLFTEMLSAKRLPQENDRVSPCLIRTENEYPLFYQVFLNNSLPVEAAVDKLHSMGAHGIDINLGCPAPKLRKWGAGCYLVKNRSAVAAIISTFRKCTELPLSVKIRLGERNREKDYLDLCRLIEDQGADCLTIHARFNDDKFCRKPTWNWIAKARESISIPIIANGGIFTVEDALNCLQISGADGLMIGRGAVMRPWLLWEIASVHFNGGETCSSNVPYDVYLRFFDLLTERFSPERRLGRLKQFTHYFSGSHVFGHQLASAVQISTTMDQAREAARRFFESNSTSDALLR